MRLTRKIINKVSSDTGIDKDAVAFAINHAWKEIEKSFGNHEYERVIFTGLMTFKLDRRTVRSYIYKMITKLREDRNDEQAKKSLKLAWKLKQLV